MSLPTTSALVIGAVVLGAGTYAFRVSGPLLAAKFALGAHPRELMNRAAVVLLAALVAVAALVQGGSPAGIARPVGVLVGGVLAWRKLPFVIVVMAAAATAAGMRLLGVH
jgi:hypothetical protein